MTPRTATSPPPDYVLTLSCPDRPAIVSTLAEHLAGQGANIVESQQFSDRDANTFFMRIRFESVEGTELTLDRLRRDFTSIAEPLAMSWRLQAATDRPRVLIMVSKYGHCLNDLLFRTASGWLNIDVVAVVSNHPDLGPMADNYDVPFHHIPVGPNTKAAAEAELLDLITALRVDLVVLARYMQILSLDLCRELDGRAINIHHSMLPSFKGASPYRQAFRRGVKLVGATAHYVTADLDEGPIIEQEVARVDHSMTAADVTALGRDNECLALSRAVRWHAENRVLLGNGRTVILH